MSIYDEIYLFFKYYTVFTISRDSFKFFVFNYWTENLGYSAVSSHHLCINAIKVLRIHLLNLKKINHIC